MLLCLFPIYFSFQHGIIARKIMYFLVVGVNFCFFLLCHHCRPFFSSHCLFYAAIVSAFLCRHCLQFFFYTSIDDSNIISFFLCSYFLSMIVASYVSSYAAAIDCNNFYFAALLPTACHWFCLCVTLLPVISASLVSAHRQSINLQFQRRFL